MTETRTYTGETGTQAFDGYAGLRIGQRYTGTIEGDLVTIALDNGRPTSVSAEQWRAWFA